jgi:bacterioferritin
MEVQELWPGTKIVRRNPRPAGTVASAADEAPDKATTTIGLLNRAHAVAQAAVRRCESEYYAAVRTCSPLLAGLALVHANDAKLDANRIAARIGELGGETEVVDLTPQSAPEEAVDLCARNPLAGLINAHLTADRAAIASYGEIAAYFALFDATTHELIEGIIAGARERMGNLAGALEAPLSV